MPPILLCTRAAIMDATKKLRLKARLSVENGVDAEVTTIRLLLVFERSSIRLRAEYSLCLPRRLDCSLTREIRLGHLMALACSGNAAGAAMARMVLVDAL